MRMRKVLKTLFSFLVVTLLVVMIGNVFGQRRYTPQMSQDERVKRFIERVKKGDRNIFRVVAYSDLKKVVDKLFENAQNNGRNFSQELTEDWTPAVRQRVVQSTLAGLFNKDPRVRLTAINWLRRFKPDGAMQRAVKQAIALETVASEVEKRKVKDLDLHDSGFIQDPDALWKPDDQIFCPQDGCQKMTYCGRTYWDGGDLVKSNRVEAFRGAGNDVDHLNASRTANVTRPNGEQVDLEYTRVIDESKRDNFGRPDHSRTGEFDEDTPIDPDILADWRNQWDDQTVDFHNDPDMLREQDAVSYRVSRYVAHNAWLDQGRWNSERSNKVHPAFLDVRKDIMLGVLGYNYTKIIRIKGEEEKVAAYDDVWDELNKLDLFITRQVWAAKVKRGEKNAFRIISKDTFFSLCRRIDGESDEHIPMFSLKIFNEPEVDVIIVGLLENKVISTRYQCALTLARIYKEPNVSKESKDKIRKALRLARKKALLIDLDKGKEFVDWMDFDLDVRNKKIRHTRRHCTGTVGFREDDEIDTSIFSVEVPVTTDVVDFVYQTKNPVKQYNDYSEISTWDFDPMGTVSLRKDITGVLQGYIPVKEISDNYTIPGEPKWFRPILDERRFIDNAPESKECVLFETHSLTGKPYIYSGPIKHLNRFQGYEYANSEKADFTIADRIEKNDNEKNVIADDIFGIGDAVYAAIGDRSKVLKAGKIYVEMTAGTLQEQNKFHSEIINYLTELKKLVEDWKVAYDNRSLVGGSANASARYDQELLSLGTKINRTIQAMFISECLFYETLVLEDKKESFLYDITYADLDAAKKAKDANGLLLREWIIGRLQERMIQLYPEIRWNQLTRMALQNYIAKRIFDESKDIADLVGDKAVAEQEVKNFLHFNVRNNGVMEEITYAQATDASMRLPVFPTAYVADVTAADAKEFILIDNYVSKPNDAVLQQATGSEFARWTNPGRTRQVPATAAWPKFGQGANSLFYNDIFENANAICGLTDEVEKRRVWIEENKEKIYQYKNFVDENNKAHRIVNALRSGDRKALRTCEYSNLKNAILITMLQASIIRYDVEVERMDNIKALYRPTDVRAGTTNLTTLNNIGVIKKDNNNAAMLNGTYADVFGFLRGKISSGSWKGAPRLLANSNALNYEKGSILRVANSNNANKVISQTPFANPADSRFVKTSWDDSRFNEIAGGAVANKLFNTPEIAHEEFWPDMYGSGIDDNIIDEWDSAWRRPPRFSKPIRRSYKLYDGVNDDRKNISSRDEMFLGWLLGIEATRAAGAGAAAAGRDRYKYQDDVIKACLGGLLNEDPRVRLTCIHLLRRIGPTAEMKGDVELALQDETVEEKKEQYLLGEKKFVNYLDVYARYQFKNVLKELQKLHAFILRKEMVQKIKKADNEKYLAELSKTLFRILTHQIDRESWWRVPLGIDPEPDAKYLYTSVAHKRLFDTENDTSLVDDGNIFKKVFKVIAGGIENYYFTNQVETAAWIVRLWDEAMLQLYDNRNRDIAVVLGDASYYTTKANTGDLLKYEKLLEFKYWVDTAITPTITRVAGTPYFGGRTGSESGAVAEDPSATAFRQFTVYQMENDPTFAAVLVKSRDLFRKAIQKGLERDIIVPYRRVRGQEFNFRDVVIIEDGYPDEDRTMRLNGDVEMNLTTEWWFKNPKVAAADPAYIARAVKVSDDYVRAEDKGSAIAQNSCFIFGTKYVVASPSAVLAEHKYYDKGDKTQKEAAGVIEDVTVASKNAMIIFPDQAKDFDSFYVGAISAVSQDLGDTAGAYWFKPGVFGIWAEPDIQREDDYNILMKTIRYRDLVVHVSEVDMAASFAGIDPTDVVAFAYVGAIADGTAFKDVDKKNMVADNLKYDQYRQVWVVSGTDIQNFVDATKAAAAPSINFYIKQKDGTIKLFATKQARE